MAKLGQDFLFIVTCKYKDILDLPEEHRPIYDSGNLFENLRSAIIKWREKWGAKRLPSFGGKHGWIYSTRTQNIDEIDFRLEIKNVP